MPCVIPQPLHCGRRLCELLEEQQEPFLLHVYLLEHGFSDTVLRRSAPFTCWPCRKLISRLGAYSFKRTIKRGGFLRFLLNKFVYNTKVIGEAWSCQSAATGGCTWSGRWRSLCGSIFEIKGKINAVEFQRLSYSDQGDVDLEEKWRALSPVSVLEHHHSSEAEEEAPSTSNVESPKETNEGSWICQSPENGGTRKRHLFQPHYGVLGSLTEERLSAYRQCSDSERKVKMIKEIMFSWENRTVAVADISNLIDFDLSKSKKNWSHFPQEMREITTEIEHIIFEEMREETLLDIILGFQCTLEIC